MVEIEGTAACCAGTDVVELFERALCRESLIKLIAIETSLK